MIKCNKCGSSNKDGSKYCGNCGNDLNSSVNVTNNGNGHEKTLFCILGFLFPIIGIIVGCIYSKKDKALSKSIIISSVVAIGLQAILFIVLFILFMIGSITEGTDFANKVNSCRNYCGYNYRVVNNTCTCKDGTKYELETGKKIEGNHGDNGSMNDNHGDSGNLDDNIIPEKEIIIDDEVTDVNMSNWKRDINEGKEVVTVIASSRCPHCIAYKPVIEDIARKYNIRLYFFESDLLSNNDYDVLTDIDSDKFRFSGSVPFTFIVRNNEYINDTVGYSDAQDVVNFLNSNGFKIDENYTYESNGI